MHDQLFGGALDRTSVTRFAAGLGLGQKFQACVDDPATASMIERDEREAKRLGITSTPTLLLGLMNAAHDGVVVRKIVHGAQSYETIRAAIDGLVAGGVSVAQ